MLGLGRTELARWLISGRHEILTAPLCGRLLPRGTLCATGVGPKPASVAYSSAEGAGSEKSFDAQGFENKISLNKIF
jgi:hypothetical protein